LTLPEGAAMLSAGRTSVARAHLLLCLPLALAACQRSPPGGETTNASTPQASTASRLMPRGAEARQRVEMKGDNRIRCKEPVPSIPCYP
jgi:hypothetical protein